MSLMGRIRALSAPALIGLAGIAIGHSVTARSPAQAQQSRVQQARTQQSQAQQSQTGQSKSGAAPAAPLVALAAQQIGVRQCLAAVNAVAQRGTIGATMQDIVLNWDHAAPDAAPFFSMTGMGAGTQRAALSITAMPTPSGSCAILVERVSSGAESCANVAAQELPPYPGGKLIDGITVLQNPKNPEETYTLIQNPGSCIVIRRQAMFQWPPKS